MKRFSFILFTFALIAMVACKKEKEIITPTPSPTITASIDTVLLRISHPNWLVLKVVAGGIDLWTIPGIFETCMKDDTYRFYKDSVFTTYENKLICSGNADSTTSSWKFINGRKKVELDFFGTKDTADIVMLTDSTMQLFVNYNGTDATIHFKKN